MQRSALLNGVGWKTLLTELARAHARRSTAESDLSVLAEVVCAVTRKPLPRSECVKVLSPYVAIANVFIGKHSLEQCCVDFDVKSAVSRASDTLASFHPRIASSTVSLLQRASQCMQALPAALLNTYRTGMTYFLGKVRLAC
jgi:hypothetical protein